MVSDRAGVHVDALMPSCPSPPPGVGVGSGGGWGCCRIVEENEGWRVRGMIEIRVRVRTLISSKFQMLLVKK